MLLEARAKLRSVLRERDCGATSARRGSPARRDELGSCGPRKIVQDHQQARRQRRNAPAVPSPDTSDKLSRDRVKFANSLGAEISAFPQPRDAELPLASRPRLAGDQPAGDKESRPDCTHLLLR